MLFIRILLFMLRSNIHFLIVSLLLHLVSASLFGQEVKHKHSIHHSFTENKGQWPKDVLFKTQFDGGNLWIQQNKFVFHLQDFSSLHKQHTSKVENQVAEVKQTVLHLNFPGSQNVQNIEKGERTFAYSNYFIGNDESRWASQVYSYGEATLKDFYAGIDLKIIEQEEQLKYEFHVLPGFDAAQIRMNYAGQESVVIDKNGRLVIKTILGEIIEEKPYAYQIRNGKIVEIGCEFELIGEDVVFKIAKYDPSVTLVIDPTLVFATYCGSPTDNFGMTATYGYDGTAYSGGVVYGNAYPVPDPFAYDISSNFTVPNNGTYGITDVFVTKYSSDGTDMLWSTYLGGGNGTQGTETAHSLICDAQNNVYIYGATSSTDFPIVGGYQSSHAGGVAGSNYQFNGVYFTNQGTDIFVSKISANGQNLLASTYFGGSANDGVNYKVTSGIYNSVGTYDSLTFNYGDQFRGEIMLDPAGNCLVASCTRSLDFPVQSAFQGTIGGGQDGVVFKLTNDLSGLVWSSYFGGSNNDACYSIKVDSSDNVLFAGGTSSSNLFTTAGSWQSAYGGGKSDGFIVKLNPSGTSIVASSFLGMTLYDQAFFVEIDRNDNVFVLGQSQGGSFPVLNAPFVNPGSSQFVIKLDPTLTTALNSTVFGNGNANINISPSAFLVDICGNVYISGWGANILQSTPMSGMPVTADAFQGTPPDGFDFYLLVIEREFADILYGSYLGGITADEHVDGGTSRFDKNGVVYQSVCGGCGGNSDFPTTPGAWSSQNLSTNCNNLVFKFDFDLIPNAEFSVDNNLGCASFEVLFDNVSSDSDSYLWEFGNGDTSSVIFNPVMVYDVPGSYQVYLYVTDSICLLTDTAEITITVTDSITISMSPDIELCTPVQVDLTAFTNGTADTFIWSTSPLLTDTLNLDFSDSTLTITPPGQITYYVEASNPGCSIIDSVVVDFIGSALSLNANDSICAGEEVIVTAFNSNPSIDFTYAWEPDSIIVTPSVTEIVTVAPNTTQYVYVTASATNGCVVEDSILINVGYIPDGAVVASAEETLVPEGSEVTLLGSPAGYSYIWLPSFLVNPATTQNTTATVDQETIFTLLVSDGVCTKSDTVLVKTFPYICSDQYIFVPNAFSPNGDMENDVLFVRGGNLIKEMTFRIYDRWGEMVFEAFDRTIGWDGTFREKELDPDVYDYYLQVICIDDVETIIKGNITLLR
jgi:gliding motility-associated-like protein